MTQLAVIFNVRTRELIVVIHSSRGTGLNKLRAGSLNVSVVPTCGGETSTTLLRLGYEMVVVNGG